MGKKRKVSPKAVSQYGERTSKRREMSSINNVSKTCLGHGSASGTSPLPSPVAAAMSISKHFETRKVFHGPNLREDLTRLVGFLESAKSDEEFLGSNQIMEISSTLQTARHSLSRPAPGQEVSEGLVEHGETLFAALKTRCAPKLSQILSEVAEKVKSKSPISPSSLVVWYFSIDRNLHDLKDYADEYGLADEWEFASANVQEKCEAVIHLLHLRGAVHQHSNPSAVDSGTARQQSFESADKPPCPLELLTGRPNAENTNKIFDHLIAYYQRQIMNTQRTGISHIFRDLRTIKLCLAKLFSDRTALKSTLESLLGKDKIQAYVAWRLKYEATWAAPAIGAIQKRVGDLNKLIDGQPLGRAELICFEFANDLESLIVERDCLESASVEDWDCLAPRLVSLTSATQAVNDFEQEYLAFQDHAYARTEITRLWLLVWRTLKAVKLPLPKEPEVVLLPGQDSRISKVDPFAIERHFFEWDGGPSSNCASFGNFLQRGDVNNPKWVEGFVSKYCTDVAKCYDEKEMSYGQFSTTGSNPVPEIIISTLQASNQQSHAQPEWNMLLHRVVLRLNHLLGDGTVLRRWWHDNTTHSVAYLDTNKCFAGIRERDPGQSTYSTRATGGGGSDKESRDNASDRPSGGFDHHNTTGGAAGNGGQDGEGSGGGSGGNDSSDGRGQDRSSKPSISADGSSSDDGAQENRPPHADNLPTATKADIDAFVRNSTSLGSPPLQPVGPKEDEPAAADIERLRDEFSSTVPSIVPNHPVASSSSPLNLSDREKIVTPVDAGSLMTRVLPSAFPYVNYPLGETRASERAMSMQIAREMRQRGITTSGPHVGDVENIAPRPLRLAPSHADDVLAPSGSLGVIRRSIGALRRLLRPLPTLRPEPLPSLPPRGSPKRPTPSPLTANRHGTSGVQRARDRGRYSPRSGAGFSGRPGNSRGSTSSFTPRRSWIRNTLDNLPWESPNHLPKPPHHILQDMPSIEAGERVVTPPEAPIDTTTEPPSQSSRIFIDRNTIRHPISPTPANGTGRTQDTNQNITARTVQGSPEQGASTPLFIEHPGDGPLAKSGPLGDREKGLPRWEWIPEDNAHYQAFWRDDRTRVRRGDAARLAAHRAIDSLDGNQAGHAIMMDIYQLLRVRYEWPLTRDYRFPQHVPGYYQPPVLPTTPVWQRYRACHGGAGTPPGYLNRGPTGSLKANDNHCVAPDIGPGSDPWFSDWRSDPNLLHRAVRSPSWGSWNGGASNAGNQDFDLYDSPNTDCDRPGDGGDQPGPDQQKPQNSLAARRGLLWERQRGYQPSSRGSVSTLNLRSPSHSVQPTCEQRTFSGGGTGTGQGSTSPAHPARRPDPARRRASGASSFGRRGSPLPWHEGSDNGLQPTPRPASRIGCRAPSQSPAPSNLVNRGTQSVAGPRSTTSDTQTTSTRPAGNPNSGNSATPTPEQYMQMTMQQLREEITHRDEDPRHLRKRKRKQDFVQVLLDYDVDGNYGNGAHKRSKRAAKASHSTLSPRVLRPREAGKVVRKKERVSSG